MAPTKNVITIFCLFFVLNLGVCLVVLNIGKSDTQEIIIKIPMPDNPKKSNFNKSQRALHNELSDMLFSEDAAWCELVFGEEVNDPITIKMLNMDKWNSFTQEKKEMLTNLYSTDNNGNRNVVVIDPKGKKLCEKVW